MSFAYPYDTVVTELRYKLLLWTLDLDYLGFKLYFNLTEFKIANKIDLDITIRDLQGNLKVLFWITDLNVDLGTIHYVTTMMNVHLLQYGSQFH